MQNPPVSASDFDALFQAMRVGVMMPPPEGGAIGLRDQPCPGCRKHTLHIRWKDDALAITCGRPPLGCGFALVEQRN
jgi:hypothetical protein